jgi:hypothetical protein
MLKPKPAMATQISIKEHGFEKTMSRFGALLTESKAEWGANYAYNQISKEYPCHKRPPNALLGRRQKRKDLLAFFNGIVSSENLARQQRGVRRIEGRSPCPLVPSSPPT